MEFSDTGNEPFGKTLLEMTVPTQLSYKTPMVIRMVKELTETRCLPWTGSHRAELCFDEALTNAMVHGNKLDAAKDIRLVLFADETRWGVIVEDEGNGFSNANLPDPNDPGYLFRDAGRGISLMSGYMDEVRYNAKGNLLFMARHRQHEPEVAEVESAMEPAASCADGSPLIMTVQDGVDIIELCVNRLTDETIGQVAVELKNAAETKRLIVLDMSHLQYVSSVGLSALVALHKRVRAKEGQLRFAAMQAPVLDIIKSAHLLPLFKTAPDRKSAVLELKRIA